MCSTLPTSAASWIGAASTEETLIHTLRTAKVNQLSIRCLSFSSENRAGCVEMAILSDPFPRYLFDFMSLDTCPPKKRDASF